MPVARKPGDRSRQRGGEQGYVLLMLMLFITLLAIFAASAAHNMAFEMKRAQEEELIHRGVQYSRAVRKYVKKFGSYPNRLEDLENTNNIRFLRKRYKDPINKNKDFKLLHLGDVQLGAGATLAGATSAAQLASGANAQGLGGAQGLIAAQGIAAAQGLAAQGQQPLNQNSGSDSDSPDGAQSGSGNSGTSPNQTFGGGPIVGVSSLSKAKTIREFNKKNHYNQWQFIYDPSTDTGGLLTTPAQPPLQVSAPNVNGQPGTGAGTAGFPSGQLGPGGLPVQPQQPSAPQPPQ